MPVGNKSMKILDSYAGSGGPLREERYRRARKAMTEEGLEALVVFSGAAISVRGDVRFFTNYHSPDLYSCAVFPLATDPILFVPYSVEPEWVRGMSWVTDIRYAPNYSAGIAEAILDLPDHPTKIGLVGQAVVPPHIISGLRSRLPSVNLVPADSLVWRLRIVLTPIEIELCRESARIADRILAEVQSILKPGMNEREILAQAEYVRIIEGGEGSLLLVASTPRLMHWIALDRAIEAGDLIQLSVEPVAPGGYWTQTIRMFSLGEPTEEATKAFRVVADAEQRIAQTLAPGKRLGDVAQMWDGIAGKHGDLGVANVPLGHGMGLDLAYGFGLTPENDLLAESGMLVVLHPNFFTERYALISGNTYLVTDTGVECLSSISKELLVV